MMENRPQYMPVQEFPWYLACSDGYVINTDSGHILVGSKKKTGYIEILMTDENGKPHHRLLHRVIAQAFVDNDACKPEVNHIDGDKTNNRADNLEWVTRGENLSHAFKTGLMPNDATPRKVVAVNWTTGEVMEFESIYKAAHTLGISQGNICMCCKGQRPYAGGYTWTYQETGDHEEQEE